MPSSRVSSTACPFDGLSNLKACILRNEMNGYRASIHGGRWNSPGVPAVYLASSQSLALLEVLVHAGNIRELSEVDLVCAWVAVPEQLVRFESSRWSSASRRPWARRLLADTRTVGDSWLLNSSDLVLAVPPVIVLDENNFLLHPDLASSAVERITPVRLDARLFRGQ